MLKLMFGCAFGSRLRGSVAAVGIVMLMTATAAKAAVYTFQDGDANSYDSTAASFIRLGLTGLYGDTNYGTDGSQGQRA